MIIVMPFYNIKDQRKLDLGAMTKIGEAETFKQKHNL